MAGYKNSFDGNVDYAYGRGVTDVAGQLNKGMAQMGQMGSNMSAFRSQTKAARQSIADLKGEIKSWSDQQEQVEKGSAAWLRLKNNIDSATKSISRLKKGMSELKLGALEKGIGGVAKGLISLNTSILTIGFDFLVSSIKRVYELQERWTKAIGGFNMKMGGMTAGLKGAQKAATMWSSTIRGLTGGDIGEGIEMFGEFTTAMGRTVDMTKKADVGWAKLGVQVARGFGLGGTATGAMFKSFENIGMSSNDAAEAMKTSIKAANAAGIPVNMLGDDLAKSTTYMARFGKEGAKTLITGAAYARKYDITLEQLRNSVEGLDAFDEAARTASKLNVAFGTMINSMDLMMEDDPAKRLESIRQQFLAQGQTYDKLSPKQRRYLSETLKLTEDQTAALLSSANANESYTDFQAKAAATEKNELSAKKMMEKQLRATAQTMYAFGAAFDRITVAIAKAIKPLLQVFGLAGKGGKDFKSFGSVMEGITKTVEEFFGSLSRNEKWNNFMVTLASDLKKAGSALKDFVMSGKAADLIGDVASGMKQFYIWVRDVGVMAGKSLKPLIPVFIALTKHLDKIVIAWGALKGFNVLRGTGMLSKAPSSGGGGGKISPDGSQIVDWGGEKGKRSSRFSAGRGLGGMAMGLGAGVAAGGTGAMVGGALGGAIGAFIPIIGPLLGPIGAGLGKLVEGLFSDGPSPLERAQERLADVTSKASGAMALLEKVQSAGIARLRTSDAQREFIDGKIKKMKEGQVALAPEERAASLDRIRSLMDVTGRSKGLVSTFNEISKGGAPTPAMLAAVNLAAKEYETKLADLRSSTDAMNQSVIDGLEIAQAQSNQKRTEIAIQENDMAVDEMRRARDKEIGGMKNATKGMAVKDMMDHSIKIAKREEELNKAIETKKLKKVDLQTRVQQDSLFVSKKMLLSEQRKQALLINGGDDFLKFKEGLKGSGMSDGNMANLFIASNQAKIAGELGINSEEMQNVIAGPGSIKPGSNAASGNIMDPYTSAFSQGRSNFARTPAGPGGGTQIISSTADVVMDGVKTGKVVFRTSLRNAQ